MKPLLITLYTYNRPFYTAMNLMSLHNQTFQDFDIMVIDDCSPDCIISEHPLVDNITKRLKDEDHMVHHIRMDENRGICWARKIVTENIHTKWNYCFDLNDDHFLEPNCLKLMMDTIKNSFKVGCVGSATPMVFWDWVQLTRQWEDWKGKINIITKELDGTPKLHRGIDYLYLDEKGKVITKPFEVAHCSQFIYRTGIVNVRDLPEYSKVGFTEETDFSLRFRKAGFRCYHQPNALNWHMLSPKGGIRATGSVERMDMCREDWGVFINNWEAWLNDNN